MTSIPILNIIWILIPFAAKAQMSVRSLQRIFKNETGITLQKYLQLTRILKSIELIDTETVYFK
jgi:transcriptional regulator GlxA family with amidase domain